LEKVDAAIGAGDGDEDGHKKTAVEVGRVFGGEGGRERRDKEEKKREVRGFRLGDGDKTEKE